MRQQLSCNVGTLCRTQDPDPSSWLIPLWPRRKGLIVLISWIQGWNLNFSDLGEVPPWTFLTQVLPPAVPCGLVLSLGLIPAPENTDRDPWSALHRVTHSLLTLWGKYGCHPYFIDGESKAQRGLECYPKSHSRLELHCSVWYPLAIGNYKALKICPGENVKNNFK